MIKGKESLVKDTVYKRKNGKIYNTGSIRGRGGFGRD